MAQSTDISRINGSGREPRVLVLGAGLAGLITAYELAARGLSVTVIEAAPFAGGRTTSWVDGRGRVLDTGAHVVADHYVNLRDVLTRINAERRLVWFNSQLFLQRGKSPIAWKMTGAPPPLHMTAAALRFRSNPWQRLKLGLAAFAAYSHPDEMLHRLDGISYADWQRRHLGDLLYHVGDAAAEAACFLPADQASAYVVLSWIRSMARNARASDVASWDGPFHEALIGPLVQAIERLRGRLLLRTAVVGIEHDDHEVKAVVTRPSACAGPFHRSDGIAPTRPDAGPQRIECDYVVSAIPVQAFQAMATPDFLRAAGLANVAELSTVPAIGVTVWFDRPISPAPRCAPLCSGLALRGFMDFASVKRTSPDEPAVVQFVLNDGRARTKHSDEQIMAELMADFRDVWPAARQRQVTDFAIERVGSAMHASLPGAYAMRPEATTRLRNLFLAGDWVRHEVKPSMEGAAVSARCAADALLRSMNQRGVALLNPPEGNFTLAVRRVRKMLSARRVAR